MKAAQTYPGLQNQPDRGKPLGLIGRALRRFLRTQCGRPAGLWGHVIGQMMARTPSNLERIRWTLSLLDVKPDDRILEVGYGPGIAIQLLSQVVSDGFIVGVDHSEVMLRQARKRNAKPIRDGCVHLQLGSASSLPAFNKPFDKIFTINSIHFWHEPVDCLRALYALLKPDGLIAVTIQPRSRNATEATTRVIGDEIVANLERAGFSRCRLEIRQIRPVAVACAIGRKLGTQAAPDRSRHQSRVTAQGSANG
jgi:SAM-dependent methyltransferase